jgi:uncharacterized protein
MKAQLPAIALVTAAFFLVANNPSKEEPPKGADQKIAEALPDEAYAVPKEARKMLVFSKTNGFRHGSIATGKLMLEEMGSRTGAFKVVISDDLGEFEKNKISGYDAICFLSTTQNVFLPHPKEMEKMSDDEQKEAMEREKRLKHNFMNYIQNGGGFVGIHAATDTCHEWKDYGRMINGFFAGHPWNSNTMVSVKVEPGMESHPLVAMFEGENVEFKEEIYQLRDPYDSKAVTMLLRLDTDKSDMTVKGINRKDNDFGIAWARQWGKGRVFYTSLGHNHEMYWHPKVVRHYLAGIQWALGDLKAEAK